MSLTVSNSSSKGTAPSVTFAVGMSTTVPINVKSPIITTSTISSPPSSSSNNAVVVVETRTLSHWIKQTANNKDISDLLSLLQRIVRSVQNITISNTQDDSEKKLQLQQALQEIQSFVHSTIQQLSIKINNILIMIQSTLETTTTEQLGNVLQTIQTHDWLAQCGCLSIARIRCATETLEREVCNLCFKKMNETSETATGTGTTPDALPVQAAEKEKNENECPVIDLLINVLSRCVCEVAVSDVETITDTNKNIDPDTVIKFKRIRELAEKCSVWSCVAGNTYSMHPNNLNGRITRLWKHRKHRTINQSSSRQHLLSLLLVDTKTTKNTYTDEQPTNNEYICDAWFLGSSKFNRTTSTRGASRTRTWPKSDTLTNRTSNHAWLLHLCCGLDKDVQVLQQNSIGKNGSIQIMMPKKKINATKTETNQQVCGNEIENPCVTTVGCMLYSGLYLCTKVTDVLLSNGITDIQVQQERQIQNMNRKTEMNKDQSALRLLGYRIRMWLLQCIKDTWCGVCSIETTTKTTKTTEKTTAIEIQRKSTLYETFVRQSCLVFVDITALLTLRLETLTSPTTMTTVPITNEMKTFSYYNHLTKDLLILRSKLCLLVLEIVRLWWCNNSKEKASTNETIRTSIIDVVQETLQQCKITLDAKVFERSIRDCLG